ncbi:Vacuolar-sorting protein SNF8 [Portunus trituberculatus]|uniref:Vacuolar-sorting protein SNF8 n=1 Tax=Portunus trituberculatus TaxID=210409 RepID=A0A5B7ELU0_PORTR|nr:Vacuolar-sorting protein SNF8 [Portunus trituberculatus]
MKTLNNYGRCKMRRRAGVGAIQRQKIQQDKFKEKGSEIQENQLEQMTLQMEKFREHLEDFAAKHKNEIKKNPQFRKQFQEMCASIGVDPLASGKDETSRPLTYASDEIGMFNGRGTATGDDLGTSYLSMGSVVMASPSEFPDPTLE